MSGMHRGSKQFVIRRLQHMWAEIRPLFPDFPLFLFLNTFPEMRILMPPFLAVSLFFCTHNTFTVYMRAVATVLRFFDESVPYWIKTGTIHTKEKSVSSNVKTIRHKQYDKWMLLFFIPYSISAFWETSYTCVFWIDMTHEIPNKYVGCVPV